MSAPPFALMVAFALLAFAANSLLCRFALGEEGGEPLSFTVLRLASGGVVLTLLLRRRGASPWQHGNWAAGAQLAAYAVGFSVAYVWLGAATGALLLFAAVQVTMLLAGWWGGERFRWLQWAGFALAVVGVIVLLLPQATAPALAGALPMLGAGLAWGLYSLQGRHARDPLAQTTGNFLRASLLALPLLTLASLPSPNAALAAIASGAVASALGYVAWYAVVPRLGALRAAALQLTVPALTAFAAVLVLGEQLTGTLVVASICILGGIGLAVRARAG